MNASLPYTGRCSQAQEICTKEEGFWRRMNYGKLIKELLAVVTSVLIRELPKRIQETASDCRCEEEPEEDSDAEEE